MLLAQICFFAGNLFLRFSESTDNHRQYFRFYRVRAIKMHIFWANTTVCVSISLYTALIVSERKRQVVIEQTRFLSTVFLCSKFKSENIYSGVNFCGKMFCGNF